MLNLRIENFISYTLGIELKEEMSLREEIDREDILKAMLPKGSMMRDFYELGKRYYTPEEKDEEQEQIEIRQKGLCSKDNIIEYMLSIKRGE